MPQLQRHAKRKSLAADRALIAFLLDTDPKKVRFEAPESAPAEWDALLMRCADNPRAAENIAGDIRMVLESDGTLVRYEPGGTEIYQNADGVRCGRVKWQACR